MNIAIIAHDKKKELMVDFCIAYSGILAQHTIIATSTTGSLIEEYTNIKVNKVLSGKQGGDQQIGARVVYDEIDLVFFFRDPLTAHPSEPNVETLLKLCDIHSIAIATNIATAEVLLQGLARGDLAWREILKK